MSDAPRKKRESYADHEVSVLGFVLDDFASEDLIVKGLFVRRTPPSGSELEEWWYLPASRTNFVQHVFVLADKAIRDLQLPNKVLKDESLLITQADKRYLYSVERLRTVRLRGLGHKETIFIDKYLRTAITDILRPSGHDKAKRKLYYCPPHPSFGNFSFLAPEDFTTFAGIETLPDVQIQFQPKNARCEWPRCSSGLQAPYLAERVLAWINGNDRTQPRNTYDSPPPLPNDRAFIGRTREIERIKAFLQSTESGTLLVSGPPGIGKTALFATLAGALKQHSHRGIVLSYFLQSNSPKGRLLVFLHRLCAALSAKYGWAQSNVPLEPGLAALDLANLLGNVSAVLYPPGRAPKQTAQREVILIDGIDETEDPDLLWRLLPRDLPRGIYLIVSSRGAQQRGALFEVGPSQVTALEIHPLSESNLSDASAFLEDHLRATLTPQECRDLVVLARGNFLVLDVVTEGLLQHTLHAREARALLASLPPGGLASLSPFYEKYWEHVQRVAARDAESNSDDLNQLAGMIGILRAPLAGANILEFLGDLWTAARFRGALKHLRQFLDVSPAFTHAKWDATYAFYHDTFRAFLQEHLAPDLPRHHRRIADYYLEVMEGTQGVSGLVEYAMDNLVHHAVNSDKPAMVNAVLTLEYCQYKLRDMQSIVAVFADSRLALDVACARQNLERFVFYILLRDTL